MESVSHAAGREGKSIEDIYQKKTQLEHILLRPDTYVGSTETQQQELWVFDAGQSRMVLRKINYVPALYKIFDEILVNAADNLVRDPVGMDTISVEIDPKANTISVMNNGKGLPVVIHKEHDCYVPELVFGQLLTSDNYNDSDCKVVGGRNGYGAKLANVFSSRFTVETCDGKRKFKGTWRNNMTVKDEAEIVDYTEPSFTKITFQPDLSRFSMKKLDSDVVSLFTKRVYDMAGTTDEKCSVFYNGDKIEVKNFHEYTDLYLLTRPGVPQIFEQCGERWEVCVSLAEAGFQSVSFVNSICTVRGGTHVTHVTDQVVDAILEKTKLASKDKVKGGCDVRPHHVKQHLWIFVRALIENPAFDGQTKETLTTKQSKFGSRCELSEAFLEKVATCGVVDLILTWLMAKSQVKMGASLKANTGKVTRLTSVPKLEDANDAGGKHSADCTLILTEGDSAKALAVAGLSVIGRDRFGVFPLRGKLLNVRDASFKQMMGNNEIQCLIKIMGLDLNREYDTELKGLRYGSIMIMTDQDHDGSHIKGLLINLFHAWWPSLVKQPGFLKEFFTPIVKVSKGRGAAKSFYSMPDYEDWKKETDNGKGFKIKYYKGLGTSTAKEAKEYFSALEAHKITFQREDEDDDDAIDLGFNKKRADDRKVWINNIQEGNTVDHTQKDLAYKDFINKELVLFSRANLIRAIPSLMDGFKPSQRKVLFACFKRNLKNDVKVAQLVGYISEKAAYHHGEASLSDTIVGMAQDFVGSNNLNLLVPQGQFGTRLQGGKDSASARYIFTRLAPVTRAIFKTSDDRILNYLDEEGISIEPEWFAPIIPMVLVNGCDGIGTGWSTSIPNFNPREIIANIRMHLKGQEMVDMAPWYAGFKGSITPSNEKDDVCGRYDVCGTIERKDDFTLAITELPVKRWTQDYREFLEEQLPQKGKQRLDNQSNIEDYHEFHTEKTVHFELVMKEQKNSRDRLDVKTALYRNFRLHSSISLSNMFLFDSEGKIKKYDSAKSIIVEFVKVRLELYHKRKAYMMAVLLRECEVLGAKARFIKLILSGELKIKRRKIADLIKDLIKHGFKAFSALKGSGEVRDADDEAGAGDADEEADAGPADALDNVGEDQDDAGDKEEEGAAADGSSRGGGAASSPAAALAKNVKEFEYLVGMPIASLTKEKVDELLNQSDLKTKELEELKKLTPENLWIRDLDELEELLNARDADKEKELKLEEEKMEAARAKAGKARTKSTKAKKVQKVDQTARGTKRQATADISDASIGKEAQTERGQKRKP